MIQLAATVWIAACALAQAPPLSPASPAQTAGESKASPHELFVLAGKSVVVNAELAIERVSVGFGDIAEATVVSPREVLLNAKAPGDTSLIIWERGGSKLFYDVTVRPNTSDLKAKVQAVRRQLNKQLPEQDVNLDFENNTPFVSGTVDDLTAADRALAIVSTLGKPVNLLYVKVPPTEAQILLNIKFANVDRNASSQLGLNLVSTGATNTVGAITTGQFNPPRVDRNDNGKTTISLSDALNIFLLRPDLNLAATIKALQIRGLFEVLAEPNVLAIDGKLASFLAGGEFPYPTLQGGGGGLGAVTVQFREFGVRLNFVASATPRGTIRLELAPEVSALDYTNGLTMSGYTIPALSTRRVHTEIELQSGQSFAIGGLMDRRLTETIMRVPGLADVPLIGNLFKSRSLQKTNSELLIIATPEIVEPTPEGQPAADLAYPKDLPDPIGAVRQHGGGPAAGKGAAPRRRSIPYEEMKAAQNQAGTSALMGPNNSGLPYTANPFQQFLPVPNTGTPALPEGAAGTAQPPSQSPAGRP